MVIGDEIARGAYFASDVRDEIGAVLLFRNGDGGEDGAFRAADSQQQPVGIGFAEDDISQDAGPQTVGEVVPSVREGRER